MSLSKLGVEMANQIRIAFTTTLLLVGAPLTAIAGPCDAYFRFDNTLVDDSGNGYNGEMIGAKGEPVDAFAKINNIPAQVHRRQIVRGAHHSRRTTVLRTVDNDPASTVPEKSTETPFGNCTRHFGSADTVAVCTR
jgi:hypothetical protein